MNYYIVVEGAGEKTVYSKWIPLINPALKQVYSLSQVTNDTFIIYNGGGFPSILSMIEDGISDVTSSTNDFLFVVVIDSEEMTREQKLNEIDAFIKSKAIGVAVNYKIVVQHFCFEAWALGNRKIVSANPSDPELVKYLKHFHVRKNDPELLTSVSTEHWNRAQFSTSYLRKLLQQKFRQTYTKSNPSAVVHPKYFDELKSRLNDTGHIDSFSELLTVFS